MPLGLRGASAPMPPFTNGRGAAMTELERQLLDAFQRLERNYSERDAAILERLRTLTVRVDALSVQVEQLQQALQQLTRGTG
jgi:hypothetical protein